MYEDWESRASLAELERLAWTAGADTVARTSQKLARFFDNGFWAMLFYFVKFDHANLYLNRAGENLLCGTGACASLVAAVLTGRSSRTNKVHLRGGTLNIIWQENNRVLMTGPAKQVFTGTIEI